MDNQVPPETEEKQNIRGQGESWLNRTDPRGTQNNATKENSKSRRGRTNCYDKRIVWDQENILRN